MRVGIDISKLHSLSKSRGIGFYAKNLYEALRKYTKVDVSLIETEEDDNYFDLIHYPFFDFFRPSLPLKKKTPTVVTVHDVTPLVFPQHYPPGIKGKINLVRQKLALKGVRAIITDSEASKKDVVKYLGFEQSKVFPIYLAPAKHFKKVKNEEKLNQVRRKYNLPEKFALYVGNVNWNKNLLNLTLACLDANLDFYLVGGGFEQRDSLDHPELKSFKEWLKKYSENPKVHILGYLEDEGLVAFYNLAHVLLMPSYYEGFGLPILEAQACGNPVITSNISSMPEVAGDGAILINPENSGEIAHAIKTITGNLRIRESLIQKGFENVRKFSWEKTAIQTADTYDQVLNKS